MPYTKKRKEKFQEKKKNSIDLLFYTYIKLIPILFIVLFKPHILFSDPLH